VRITVKDSTLHGCAKLVSVKVDEGWTPVSKIKVDNSMDSWGVIKYACVLEIEDTPEMVAKRKKGRFNTSTVGVLW
jgi:hypothetical protein